MTISQDQEVENFIIKVLIIVFLVMLIGYTSFMVYYIIRDANAEQTFLEGTNATDINFGNNVSLWDNDEDEDEKEEDDNS